MMRPMLMMLAIAAFVSPNALAVDFDETFEVDEAVDFDATVDLVQPPEEVCASEIADDSGWFATDGGAARTFLIHGCVQITHEDGSGGVWAKSKVHDAVQCSVHVRDETGVGARVSWHRNGVEAEGYVYSDVTSDLHCSGEASITTTHGGGIGPRAATATLRESTYYRDDQGVNQVHYERSTQCQYFAAVAESFCTNAFETSVLHDEINIEGVPSTFQVCYQVGWVDHVAPDLVTPLTGAGTNDACGDVVELDPDVQVLLDLLR